MDEFVRKVDYGISEKKLCFGINVYSSSNENYNYSIRVDSRTRSSAPRPNQISSSLSFD